MGDREATDFSQLSFGAPAAERDIDRGLLSYFVESDVFSRVKDGSKKILLGNRGSGKSAIFKVLAQQKRQEGALVIELSPEDYSYEMLSAARTGEERGAWAKQGAFAVAWKYLIYVLVMKNLTQEGGTFKRGPGAQIYEYLRDNHKGFQENPIGVLISYLKRLEGFKIGSFEAGVKTRELNRLYKLEEIEPLLGALEELCSKRQVFVLVDELDRGWDASDEAKAFVAGLFQACVSINERIARLGVYVSLRQELYDSIPSLYEDAQKYRDIIATINWSEAGLLELVSKRIRFALPGLQGSSDEECWHQVFPETLEYRKTKSFNYLIDRTLYRPREIIQFCTDIVDAARAERAKTLDYSLVSRAEIQYSESRSKDIAAEYRFHHPGLLSVFEVFRGRNYAMDRDELELLALGIGTGEFRLDGDAEWARDQEPEAIIEILWRIGFLRAQAVGGVKAQRRSGSSYLGPHQVANLNLRNLSRFHVHPMFRSYLGLKEAKGAHDEDLE